MTSVGSNFNFLCGRPHGAGPPPPSTCVHLNLTHIPLRVDVINGCPLSENVAMAILSIFLSSYALAVANPDIRQGRPEGMADPAIRLEGPGPI